jgi:hypothetical protein
MELARNTAKKNFDPSGETAIVVLCAVKNGNAVAACTSLYREEMTRKKREDDGSFICIARMISSRPMLDRML